MRIKTQNPSKHGDTEPDRCLCSVSPTVGEGEAGKMFVVFLEKGNKWLFLPLSSAHRWVGSYGLLLFTKLQLRGCWGHDMSCKLTA